MNDTRRLLHGADYNYEQWLEYPDVLYADFELMKKAKCNVMSVGIFSWSMLEPDEGVYHFDWLDRLMDRLAENGIGAILATPSGSKPGWMSRNHPDSCRVGPDGKREPHGGRHNHCRSSRSYRDACVRINTALAERYANHPALEMWHVSNEYNASRCYCPSCLAEFRAWLKLKYGTIDALNRAWWTAFWSHRYADWDEIEPVDPSIHGLTLDWARFTSDQTLDFFLEESAPLRKITPQVPITTNFMTPDVGLDYWKFARHVDVVSWDSYPRWHATGDDASVAVTTAFYHDLFRSLKGKPFLLMESTPSATNWQGISKPKKPGMHLLSSLQAVAHGSDSVQYFQWRQSRGGCEKFHGAVVSHLGSEGTRTFRDVASVGETLASLRGVAGSAVRSEVAVVYDFQNAWALDGAELPNSVEKRYQQTCVEHYAAFWRRGISCDIADSAETDFSRYRLLVLPMLYMFREGVAERLRAYVTSGGTVVATYLTGLVDGSDLCALGGTPGALTDVFGIAVEFTDTIVEGENQSIRFCPGAFPQGESVAGGDSLTGGKSHAAGDLLKNGESHVSGGAPSGSDSYRAMHYADAIEIRGAAVHATFGSGALKGMPALTENAFGKGRALYMAARSGTDFLDRAYGALARRLALRSAIGDPSLGLLPGGVSVRERVAGGKRYLFAMNFAESDMSLNIGPGRFRDAADGSEVPETITLGPYGIRVLAAEEQGPLAICGLP